MRRRDSTLPRQFRRQTDGKNSIRAVKWGKIQSPGRKRETRLSSQATRTNSRTFSLFACEQVYERLKSFSRQVSSSTRKYIRQPVDGNGNQTCVRISRITNDKKRRSKKVRKRYADASLRAMKCDQRRGKSCSWIRNEEQ